MVVGRLHALPECNPRRASRCTLTPASSLVWSPTTADPRSRDLIPLGPIWPPWITDGADKQKLGFDGLRTVDKSVAA